MSDVLDLIHSDAKLYIADYGTAVPDIDTAMSAAVNYTAFGWIKEEFVIKPELELAEFYVSPFLGPLDQRIIDSKVTAEFEIAELKAAALAYAMGQDGSDTTIVTSTAAGAGQVGFKQFNFGNNPLVLKVVLCAEGFRYLADGTPLAQRYFFERATLKINGDLTYSKKKDSYIDVPVVMTALMHPTTGYHYRFQDVTAEATS